MQGGGVTAGRADPNQNASDFEERTLGVSEDDTGKNSTITVQKGYEGYAWVLMLMLFWIFKLNHLKNTTYSGFCTFFLRHLFFSH